MKRILRIGATVALALWTLLIAVAWTLDTVLAFTVSEHAGLLAPAFPYLAFGVIYYGIWALIAAPLASIALVAAGGLRPFRRPDD